MYSSPHSDIFSNFFSLFFCAFSELKQSFHGGPPSLSQLPHSSTLALMPPPQPLHTSTIASLPLAMEFQPLPPHPDSHLSFSSFPLPLPFLVELSDAHHPPRGCRLKWVSLDLHRESPGEPQGWLAAPFASLSTAQAVASVQIRARKSMVESDRVVDQVLRIADGDEGHVEQTVVQVPLLRRASIGALAGGIAGGFTNVVLHPIDTVKTKLQTRGASKLYSGPFDVVRKVVASEGISGLYSGVQAAFVGSVMSSSIYFGTYEMAKGILSTFLSLPTTLVPPVAAALGNITSSAILVPKEVVKQRMQAGAIGSAREVFLHTVRSEGVLGLYAGYSAALLRNLPSNMISFSTFEYLKLAWLGTSGRSVLAPWQSVLSGALAGALSAAVTTPLDVAKTRLMTQARLAVSSSGVSGLKAEAAARAQAIAAYTYSGVSSTLQQIWMEEGARALMKGIFPRVLYSACFSALGFAVFETTRAYFLANISTQTRVKSC